MKKLSVVLFTLFFIAIAILFILHFTGNRTKVKTNEAGKPESSAQGIAFINIDTVIYKFDMFFDRRQDLMDKQKKAEAELNSKGSLYERNAKDYQDKVSKGLVTRATAAEMEKGLLQQQQELVTLRDNLQSGLLEEEQVMNRQIVDYITTYLSEHKSEYNYQYILGKSFGSVVLYGDSGLDITRQVLAELNKQYKTEKK